MTALFDHFTIIPAIDLKAGAVVRLVRGAMDSATVYGDDPAATARHFEREGAEVIHVVDLDGAIAGSPQNLEALRTIRAAVRCGLEVSGGLRSMESIRAVIQAGADLVSIGSAAFLDPGLILKACAEFPRTILGSVDSRDGHLAIRGWVETSQLKVNDAIARFRAAGVAALILTDIARDGTEAGVNPALYSDAAAVSGVPVIASGGVAGINDIRALAALFPSVAGVISGRALYEGRFSLPEAITAVGE